MSQRAQWVFVIVLLIQGGVEHFSVHVPYPWLMLALLWWGRRQWWDASPALLPSAERAERART